MDFGQTIKALQAGQKVVRPGMRGAYLQLQIPDANSKMSLPYIYMRTTSGQKVPWTPGQADIFSEDWTILIS